MAIFFSIIIPTFNSEKTLKQCLNSVVSQTFKDYEVIIIDGLSSDSTLRTIKKYSAQYELIRWISEKDSGIYDAMNKGIKLAKGEWLYFLGSDDSLFSSDTLNQIQKELQDFDVVYGNVTSSRFNGIYDGPFTKEKIYEKNICHQAILYNKRVFQKIGGFNLKYRSQADWDHNLSWFLSDKIRKTYVDVIIANYADGGFSSLNADTFYQMKRWKYSVLTKSEILFKDKLKIISSELFRAIKRKRKDQFFTILFQIPDFLL